MDMVGVEYYNYKNLLYLNVVGSGLFIPRHSLCKFALGWYLVLGADALPLSVLPWIIHNNLLLAPTQIIIGLSNLGYENPTLW